MKSLQGKRYEALALYKRVIELNPKDYQANFDVAQMFDQVEPPLALLYYEQGLKQLKLEIEIRNKLNCENMTDEEFSRDIKNIVPPEILNNIGVLRLEKATSFQQSGATADEALSAFKQAMQNIDLLLSIDPEQTKLKSLRITVLFNMGYWHEQAHQYD